MRGLGMLDGPWNEREEPKGECRCPGRSSWEGARSSARFARVRPQDRTWGDPRADSLAICWSYSC